MRGTERPVQEVQESTRSTSGTEVNTFTPNWADRKEEPVPHPYLPNSLVKGSHHISRRTLLIKINSESRLNEEEVLLNFKGRNILLRMPTVLPPPHTLNRLVTPRPSLRR